MQKVYLKIQSKKANITKYHMQLTIWITVSICASLTIPIYLLGYLSFKKKKKAIVHVRLCQGYLSVRTGHS